MLTFEIVEMFNPLVRYMGPRMLWDETEYRTIKQRMRSSEAAKFLYHTVVFEEEFFQKKPPGFSSYDKICTARS